MLKPGRRRQQGLSLIELMISITLGLIILAALVAVFSQNSQSFRQNDALAQMQDSARFAMEALSRDLSMAGFNGGIYSALDVVPNAASPTSSATSAALQANTDCGSADANLIPWFLQAANRVEFENHTATAEQFPCLGQTLSPVMANTDRVAIRRAAGQSTADMSASATAPTLRSYTYYLQSNGTLGTLIHTGNLGGSGSGAYTLNATDKPLNPPMSFFKWVPRVYFVRSFAHVAGDGIPALCRMELQHVASPSMATECLADGVQNLQIEWGMDSNNDCIPDSYTSTPTAANLATQAVTARIWLLVRASKPEAGYTDSKTYTIGDYTVPAANDGYRRRVYTTTVQLRNPIGSNGPCLLPSP